MLDITLRRGATISGNTVDVRPGETAADVAFVFLDPIYLPFVRQAR